MKSLRRGLLVLLLLGVAVPAHADTSAADCTITPKDGTAEPEKRPCLFSQRQGFVDIRFEDEEAAFLELAPAEGAGNYLDKDGKPAYRNKGLGSDGVVFTTEMGIVRVYWSDRPLP